MKSDRGALLEILEGVDALTVDTAAKEKFRRLVGSIATTHGYDWIERANRIAFAKDLLKSRVGRPEVRDRLMATYDISRPQAYRVISHALQLSHKLTSDETLQRFNGHINQKGNSNGIQKIDADGGHFGERPMDNDDAGSVRHKSGATATYRDTATSPRARRIESHQTTRTEDGLSCEGSSLAP